MVGKFNCGQRDLCNLSEAQQEHDNVCGKISKMCGKKEGAGKRLPKPHGFISDGAREKSRACANSSEGRAGA